MKILVMYVFMVSGNIFGYLQEPGTNIIMSSDYCDNPFWMQTSPHHIIENLYFIVLSLIIGPSGDRD